MNEDYQVYMQEYEKNLSRVRSFLSSNVRSRTTLRECEKLLGQAQRCADAMEQLATESGDAFQINECKRKIQQEITPLVEEVKRAKSAASSSSSSSAAASTAAGQAQQKAALFSGYRAPSLSTQDQNQNKNNTNAQGQKQEQSSSIFGANDGNDDDDMEMLIRNSEDLLLESQALCNESEQTGSETIHLMGRQREQLTNASNHLVGAQAYFSQAKSSLDTMTRKALRNKRFLQGIIVILAIANIVVFIAILKKNIFGKKTD